MSWNFSNPHHHAFLRNVFIFWFIHWIRRKFSKLFLSKYFKKNICKEIEKKYLRGLKCLRISPLEFFFLFSIHFKAIKLTCYSLLSHKDTKLSIIKKFSSLRFILWPSAVFSFFDNFFLLRCLISMLVAII